ncbi:hypothetical protein SLS61_003020 [Didymella pomorum]
MLRTLFRANSWPTSSDDDPIAGWVYEDYNKHFLAAREDTYGAGFSLVRDLLLCFCRRVAHGGISFELHCVDAAHIGARMGDRKYDRIEISNICDNDYMKSRPCLCTFAPLLKSKADNPHATLLFYFMNFGREIQRVAGTSDPTANALFAAAYDRVQSFFQPDTSALRTRVEENVFDQLEQLLYGHFMDRTYFFGTYR